MLQLHPFPAPSSLARHFLFNKNLPGLKKTANVCLNNGPRGIGVDTGLLAGKSTVNTYWGLFFMAILVTIGRGSFS